MNLRVKKSLLVYCYSNLPNFSTHENIFCWLLQSVQIRLRRVEFLIKFVFPNLMIHVEFSKCLFNVSLNKGKLKCKSFILTSSKLTCRCRHVFLSHATHTYSSTQTFFFFFAVVHLDSFVHLGVFFFTVIARTNLLVPADVSFPLPWPIQTKPSTRTFSYH